MSQNSSKISLSKKGKSLIINNNTDIEFEYRGFESRPLRRDKLKPTDFQWVLLFYEVKGKD